MLLKGGLNNGGAERSLINLANELSNYYNVIIVCADSLTMDYDTNVRIIEIQEFNSNSKKLKALKKLKKIKEEYKIDITISYTTLYNFYNVITKKNDKTIISIRNHISTKKEVFKLNLYHKISLKLCDKIVCCSKSVYEDEIKKFHSPKNKTCVIENFCDDKLIKNCLKQKISNEEKKYICNNMIISMARLVKHKGHEHIIKAMSLVVKKVNDAKLLIFGRGDDKKYLSELINKYNLNNNVFIMNYIKNPFRFFNNAKVFVLASDYEGFPNVIIEAMTCKLPIISTSSPGGSIEIIDEDKTNTYVNSIEEKKYGILIPSFKKEHRINSITKNEELLSDAILSILNNKDKYNYYSKQSSNRIKKYSKEVIMKKWVDLIEQL